jgi:hypothetical protein
MSIDCTRFAHGHANTAAKYLKEQPKQQPRCQAGNGVCSEYKMRSDVILP